jgi:hypothetical protein
MFSFIGHWAFAKLSGFWCQRQSKFINLRKFETDSNCFYSITIMSEQNSTPGMLNLQGSIFKGKIAKET